MTYDELFAVRKDENKLKSLHCELAELEDFNPYKKNIITDMPIGGGSGKVFQEWYAERKDSLEKEIVYYQEKLLKDRAVLEEYISSAPYPECDIIRYRVINGMGWADIGDLLSMDRRTAARKFRRYVKLPTMPA